MRFLILTVFFLFLGFVAQGQVFGPPKNIPKEYWGELERPDKRAIKEELREQKQFEKRSSEDYDFLIPEVPLPSTARIAAEGNWGRGALEIPGYEQEILRRLKGKFCMAIIDTGEPDHQEVIKYKMPGYASRSYTGEPPVDGHFHATHVAGSQVAKVGDTYIGIAHVAAQAGNFKQVYFKACTNSGGCFYSAVAQAIRDFTDYYKSELKPNGWDAGINMSLGGGNPSAEVSQAMKAALSEGIVLFVSAGNNGRRDISFPAEDDSANAVGAYAEGGQKASFSNWGPEMFLNGPGVLIYSTCLGDTECVASGTSMSSPQVAAVYALLKMMMPDKSPGEVVDFMARYATDAGDPGFDEEFGHGIPKMGPYLEAMGDVPPEDPCEDCPCPPCPPPADAPYQYFTISLPGPYNILWLTSEMSYMEPISYEVPPQSTTIGDRITVRNLVVEVGSQMGADDAFANADEITKNWFKNRGLLLREGSGKREALAYIDFFYRMHLQKELKGSTRVISFDADGLHY